MKRKPFKIALLSGILSSALFFSNCETGYDRVDEGEEREDLDIDSQSDNYIENDSALSPSPDDVYEKRYGTEEGAVQDTQEKRGNQYGTERTRQNPGNMQNKPQNQQDEYGAERNTQDQIQPRTPPGTQNRQQTGDRDTFDRRDTQRTNRNISPMQEDSIR